MFGDAVQCQVLIWGSALYVAINATLTVTTSHYYYITIIYTDLFYKNDYPAANLVQGNMQTACKTCVGIKPTTFLAVRPSNRKHTVLCHFIIFASGFLCL